MSNLANYSPYNKTYKFILFQNQAYHQKAKKNVRSVIRTNLRYNQKQQTQQTTPMTPSQDNFYFQQNPQYSKFLKNLQQNQQQSHFSLISFKSKRAKSMLMSGFNKKSPSKIKEKNYFIDKQKRVIHKNHSYQKFKNKAITKYNKQLADRLLKTSCEVIKNKKTSDSYRNHLKYKNIRKLYNEGGTRKYPLSMGNSSFLCPTLADFNKSRLGQKFLEKDMSFYSAKSINTKLNSPKRSETTQFRMRRSQF